MPKLVDSLKAKKPVIINLEKIETDTARKIFDFLSGATYALNGNVQKVANNIFIFAPENVDVAAYIDQQAPVVRPLSTILEVADDNFLYSSNQPVFKLSFILSWEGRL